MLMRFLRSPYRIFSLTVTIALAGVLLSWMPRGISLSKDSPSSTSAPGNKFNICSFNIRYSNDHDGVNNWDNRKQWVADYIHYFDVTIVGTQEVQHDQYKDLALLLPEYASIGVPSNENKPNGEYELCAIYFRPDRLKLLDSGDFWLSDTPSTPSKGWDAIFQRIVTWGKFENVIDGSEFYFFNTHFSHVGETARTNSARVMRDMISQIAGNQPVMVTGDFNARPDTKTYQTMTEVSSDGYGLFDAAKRAEVAYGPNYTFNCFGGCEIVDGSVIDYIFVSRQINVKSFAVLTEQRRELYISDHYPLLASVTFGN